MRLMKLTIILLALANLVSCAAYDSSPDCVGNMPKCSPRPSNIFNGWEEPVPSDLACYNVDKSLKTLEQPKPKQCKPSM